MNIRNDEINPLTYSKAFFIYAMTVGMAFTAKSSGILWSNTHEEETENFSFPLKRNALITSQSQSLPLIEGIEIGRFNLTTSIQQITLQNNTAYIAAMNNGIYIVDVTNSSEPLQIGSQKSSDATYHFDLIGNDIYVADGSAGLRIYDLTDVNNTDFLGVYLMSGTLQTIPLMMVSVINNKSFVANAATGVIDVVDVSDPSQVFRVNIDTPSVTVGLFVTDTTAYVADYDAGLFIFDITDITYPRLLGTYNQRDIVAVFVTNKIAYLSCHSNTVLSDNSFLIINISDPIQPLLLSNISLPGESYYLFVTNSTAYVGTRAGLQIIDVNSPQSSEIIGSYITRGTAICVTVTNSIAYVIDDFVGLYIVDVSNASAPLLLGTFSIADSGDGIAVVGSFAYVMDLYNGLYIVDVSNFSNPIQVSYCQIKGVLLSLDISDNVVYIADSYNGIHLVNVSNISNPILYRTYELSGAIDIVASNNIVFVAAQSSGFNIIDTTKLPQQYSSMTFYENRTIIDWEVEGDNIFYTATESGLVLLDNNNYRIGQSVKLPTLTDGVTIMGSTLYLACYEVLLILDISIPPSYSILGYYPLARFGISALARKVAVDTTNAYISIQNAGLLILNVSNPLVPVPLGFYNLSGYTSNVVITGTIAYIANHNLQILPGFGLKIFNISDPMTPYLLGSYDSAEILSLSVVGTNVYLIDAIDGLLILDVTDPQAPQLSSQFLLPDSAYRILVLNNLAYLTTQASLIIAEVSDPFNTQKLGNLGLTGIPHSVYVSDNIAYVSALDVGLQLIDVTDPTLPSSLRIYKTGGEGEDIGLFGNYAYVAGGDLGLSIVNLGVAKNRFATQYTASQVAIKENIVYLADTSKTISILNVSNYTFQLTSHYVLSYQALDMQIAGDYLYIAEGIFGVEILDISNSTSPIFAGRVTSGLTNAKSLAVEEGKLYVVDNYNVIVIFNINPLFYLSGQMVIQEGQRHCVTPSDVALVGSNDISPSQLVMMAINITHGQFELSSQPGTPITNFTLAQVQASQIIFAQDGGKTAPSFDLLVDDGVALKGPFTANIIFQPVNYPPVLGYHFIQINEGQSIILSLANFNATDDETPSSQLQFITMVQSNSQFGQISQPGVIITRFTQQDLVNGNILFRHLDQSSAEDLTPFCMVSVFDGQLYSTPVPVQFVYHASPKLIHNQMMIYSGQTLTISSNELQATDTQVQTANLIFIINNVTHGSFTKMNFTQGEVAIGLIQFQHDGSDQLPSYRVSVQDPFMVTTSQAAVITFTKNNQNLLLDVGGIAGTVAGGTVGLAGLFGGIFAYRNYNRDQQSRKNNPFSSAVYETLKPIDAANFHSPKGQQFVQALQTLKQELSQQGIDVERMGTWELNQLAEQITFAIVSELRIRKNWRGESLIQAQVIAVFSPEITSAVQKIRAGVYEPPEEITVDTHLFYSSNEYEMGNMQSYKQPLLAGF